MAIGGVSLEVFGKEEEFNWQKELVLITKPLPEGLKGLTEKPRKVDRLRSIIAERHLQTLKIENAISTVDALKEFFSGRGKTLLNISTEREGERMIYHGIPWELAHIKIHSIFQN